MLIGFAYGYCFIGKTKWKSISKIIMDFVGGLFASIFSTVVFGYEIGFISSLGVTFAEMVINWSYVVIFFYVILFMIGAFIGDKFEKR